MTIKDYVMCSSKNRELSHFIFECLTPFRYARFYDTPSRFEGCSGILVNLPVPIYKSLRRNFPQTSILHVFALRDPFLRLN
jgi:hypothetical protein